MGYCVYFHRTWTPGYGEYVDPNRLSRFHRRLALVKKVCAAVFAAVVLSAIVLLLYLLYTQCNNNNCNDCKAVANNHTDSAHHSNVTHAPVTEAFAGPLGRFLHATKSSSESTTTAKVEEEVEFVSSVQENVERRSESRNEHNEITSTEIPTTEIPTTEIPTTEITTTEIPTTEIPTTEIPTTEIPMSTIFEAEEISTGEMIIEELVTEAPNMENYNVSTSETYEKVEDTTINWDDFESDWVTWDNEDYSSNGNINTSTTTESNYPSFDSSYDVKTDDEEALEAKTGNKRDSPHYNETYSSSSFPASISVDIEGCSETEFQCALSKDCIPMNKRCDGRFDCNTHTTSSSMGPLYGDRSDELNCTCEENFVPCNQTDKLECVHNSLVCDTVKDCSNGSDESICVELSGELNKIERENWSRQHESGIQGHVMVRVKGSWHPYCSDDWTSDLARKICRWLNHTRVVKLLKIPLVDLNKKGLGNDLAEESIKISYGKRFFVLGRETDKPFPMTSGTVDEIATETYVEDGLNCTIAYLICAA